MVKIIIYKYQKCGFDLFCCLLGRRQPLEYNLWFEDSIAVSQVKGRILWRLHLKTTCPHVGKWQLGCPILKAPPNVSFGPQKDPTGGSSLGKPI